MLFLYFFTTPNIGVLYITVTITRIRIIIIIIIKIIIGTSRKSKETLRQHFRDSGNSMEAYV